MEELAKVVAVYDEDVGFIHLDLLETFSLVMPSA